MAEIHPEAAKLNEIIAHDAPVIYELLSQKGRAIFYPKGGILKQAGEAKGKKINATIGIAKEEDGVAMHLPSMMKYLSLSPDESLPYLPSYGKQELREIWSKKIREKNPSLVAPMSMPVVTSGLSHGLTTLAYLFLNQGEKLILADKFWGNYKLMFQNGFGVIFDTFNTFKKGSFDLQSFEQKINEGGIGKKVILLNNPNNPTGYTPTKTEGLAILDILQKAAQAGNSLLVACDDAYFGLVYEDHVMQESLFAQLADLHPNLLAVKIDGATKEDYAWGLRVGFMTYAIKGLTDEVIQALEAKTAGAVRGTVSVGCHLSQSLLFRTYQSPSYDKEKKEKYELLKKRYLTVRDILNKKSDQYKKHFSALPFNSGYFMCLELKEGITAEEVRKVLLDEFDTGIIAIGQFIRIAFSSCPTEHLESLFENIYKACEHIASEQGS